MPNLLVKYSNGWGHLIMSVVTMGAALYLINANQVVLGTTLIGLVSSAWFVPGAARAVAAELNTPTAPADLPVDQMETIPQMAALNVKKLPPPGGN